MNIDPSSPDTDFGGIPDDYEIDHGLQPTQSLNDFNDIDDNGAGDGLLNREEMDQARQGIYSGKCHRYSPITDICYFINYGTSPTDSDTDDDGMKDGFERDYWESYDSGHDHNELTIQDMTTEYYKTMNWYIDFDTDSFHEYSQGGRKAYTDNLHDPDSDNDGLTDAEENFINPDRPIFDHTGNIPSIGDTKTSEADARDPDSDGDNLIDGDEIGPKTNILNKDSDNDGVEDGMDIDMLNDLVLTIELKKAWAKDTVDWETESVCLTPITITSDASADIYVKMWVYKAKTNTLITEMLTDPVVDHDLEDVSWNLNIGDNNENRFLWFEFEVWDDDGNIDTQLDISYLNDRLFAGIYYDLMNDMWSLDPDYKFVADDSWKFSEDPNNDGYGKVTGLGDPIHPDGGLMFDIREQVSRQNYALLISPTGTYGDRAHHNDLRHVRKLITSYGYSDTHIFVFTGHDPFNDQTFEASRKEFWIDSKSDKYTIYNIIEFYKMIIQNNPSTIRLFIYISGEIYRELNSAQEYEYYLTYEKQTDGTIVLATNLDELGDRIKTLGSDSGNEYKQLITIINGDYSSYFIDYIWQQTNYMALGSSCWSDKTTPIISETDGFSPFTISLVIGVINDNGLLIPTLNRLNKPLHSSISGDVYV